MTTVSLKTPHNDVSKAPVSTGHLKDLQSNENGGKEKRLCVKEQFPLATCGWFFRVFFFCHRPSVLCDCLCVCALRCEIWKLPRWHFKFPSKIYREAKLKRSLHLWGLSSGTPCCAVISEKHTAQRENLFLECFPLLLYRSPELHMFKSCDNIVSHFNLKYYVKTKS